MNDQEMRKAVEKIAYSAMTAKKNPLLPADVKGSLELVAVLLHELVNREVSRNAKG